jgi:hypothetical protein
MKTAVSPFKLGADKPIAATSTLSNYLTARFLLMKTV